MQKVTRIVNDNKFNVLQYMAAITASITSLGCGAIMTWSSPALPYLTSNQVESPLSMKQFDVITPLLTAGSFFGYILNPLICKKLGTKYTLLLFAVPQIASWIIVIVSENFTLIYVSKILGGIGYGAGICTVTEYLSEISNLENRAIFFTINNLFISLGNLLPVLFGSYLSYFTMNIALAILPIVFFLIFLVLPNSSFFLKRNKKKEAEIKKQKNSVDSGFNSQEVDAETGPKNETALKFCAEIALKSDTETVSKTINYIDCLKSDNKVDIGQTRKQITSKIDALCVSQAFTKVDKEFHNEIGTTSGTNNLVSHIYNSSDLVIDDSTNSNKFATKHFNWKNCATGFNVSRSRVLETNKYNIKESKIWKLFTLPNNRRALLIMMCLSAIDTFGGHIPIITYNQQFLTHKKSVMSPDKAAALSSIIRLFAIFISTQIIGKIGRRTLLLSCGIIRSISYALSGIFFFLDCKEYNIESIGWFPIFWVTISEIASVISIGNLYFALQGELFVKDLQSMAISASNIFYMLFELLTLIKFQELMDSFGIYVIFWFFSVCTITFSFIVFFITPETQGKNIDEIQEELKRRTFMG